MPTANGCGICSISSSRQRTCPSPVTMPYWITVIPSTQIEVIKKKTRQAEKDYLCCSLAPTDSYLPKITYSCAFPRMSVILWKTYQCQCVNYLLNPFDQNKHIVRLDKIQREDKTVTWSTYIALFLDSLNKALISVLYVTLDL